MFKKILDKDVFDIIEYQVKKNVTKENIKKTYEQFKSKFEEKFKKTESDDNTSENGWKQIDNKIYVFTPGLTKEDLKVLKFDNHIIIKNINNDEDLVKVPINFSNYKIGNVKFNDGCLVLSLFDLGEIVNIEID